MEKEVEIPYEASVMAHDLKELMEKDETTLGDLRKYCDEMKLHMDITFWKAIK